jgi:tetratricopeptide (TPR) repeat protein
VALDPSSAAARFGLGRWALASGDHATARDQLDAALRADPKATRVHYTLAMTYRALGDTARAEAHLRQWKEGFSPAESLKDVQIYPADPHMEEIGGILQTAVAYETRGVRALDAGRWQEAIAEFRGGLAVAPRDPALHQNLGTALYLSGDERNAREAFETAARLSPGYARAHFSLGLLAEARGGDGEALARYAAAVRHDPTFTDARFRLAEGLRRNGQVEASVAHYEDILEADPQASQARFARAMALVRLQRYRDGRAALEEATRAHPDQPGLPHALARVLAAAPDDAVRDGARALAIVEELRKTYGVTPPLLESFAMALAEVGRFADAAARQREAMAAARTQGRTDLAQAMSATLQRYESGLPCRTPWRDDDPVHVPPRASGLRF